eukprot:TRINITY_DN113195_c0_g1_i1.p1 TRINITY_DN113195_c0_g1~~TRINITY_DN113195_c0_g1_i1.p1  ORF type:complete len:479 (-),score=148.80 TRINITY_DN113195_c0_g1_i1:42-1478(-)
MTSRFAEVLTAAGQGHVLEDWEKLSAEERESLDNQLAVIEDRIGIAKLTPMLKTALDQHAAGKSSEIAAPPAEWVAFADGTDTAAEERWEQLGLDEVAKGACATCVLAGGMGTRLGSSFPKGMLGDPATGEKFLPSDKSLFQVYSERITCIQRRAQAKAGLAEAPTIYFLVLTSEATHKLSIDFFQKHAYFGLKEEQVLFFQQAMMPCLTEEGKMMMETPCKVATSPNGNAGIYDALKAGGVLDRLKAAGVKWVQSFSVDNVLVRVADPVWYGYCAENDADVVVKSIPKRSWNEAVGVLTLRGGKPSVIEYSEIGEERAQQTDESGTLKYNAANICLQSYSLDFLCGPAQDFPTEWHIARKDIPTKAGKVKGIKLEGFIFDVFEMAKKFRMLQVSRAAEFSAIKNASDSGKADTPQTALQSISRLHRQWVRKAGGTWLAEDNESGEGPVCEVSPLVSYRGEGLEERVKTPIEGAILIQ